MARTSYAELGGTLRALERASGVAPGRLDIARANGRSAVVLDDGRRDVSPWLTSGELRDWLWAAIRGAYLVREDARCTTCGRPASDGYVNERAGERCVDPCHGGEGSC